jgi:hypothetical protein
MKGGLIGRQHQFVGGRYWAEDIEKARLHGGCKKKSAGNLWAKSFIVCQSQGRSMELRTADVSEPLSQLIGLELDARWQGETGP